MLTHIAGTDAIGALHPRRKTYGVMVGHVRVGGGAPIVVQSMTNTDTADVESTFKQTVELAEAGSEIVRWTVNIPEAAARSEEHTSELQSHVNLVCRLLLEKKKNRRTYSEYLESAVHWRVSVVSTMF